METDEQELREHYVNVHKTRSKIISEVIIQKLNFWNSLILVSASIVGVLISLHNNTAQCLYIRLVFLLSILLLCLGTLSSAFVAYDYSNLKERLRQVLQTEFELATNENRKANPVHIDWKKRTSIFQIISYCLLISGFVILIVYAFLNTLIV